MATFGGWLDAYDGPSGTIAALAAFWRSARDAQGPDQQRPRAHAVDGVSAWLLAHAPEDLHPTVREAIRAYKAVRAGQPEPLPSGPVTSPPEPIEGPEQPLAPSPAQMASLGRIEQGQRELLARYEGLQRDVGAMRDELRALAQVTGLWGEPEGDQGPVDGRPAVDGPPAAEPQVTGSLWREIAVPEPNFAQMAADGDPRAAGEEAG